MNPFARSKNSPRATVSIRAIAFAVVATVLVTALGTAIAQGPRTYRIDVPLVNHLQAGMNEQDVFVEREPGSGQVYRITAEHTDLNAPLYAAAVPTAHNPIDPADVGPFPKGIDLNITLGEWLAGSGTATITCDGDSGRFSSTYQNLVPNGVYTLWTFFLARPFPASFMTYDLPLGARDGTENVFVADANGHAVLDVEVTPCIQLSGDQLLSGVTAAYHSDGLSYGPYPGEFGTVSHLQILNFLPTNAQAAGN